MHEGTITINCENSDVKVRGLTLDEEDELHNKKAEHDILGSEDVWTVVDPRCGPILFSIRVADKAKREEIGVILYNFVKEFCVATKRPVEG